MLSATGSRLLLSRLATTPSQAAFSVVRLEATCSPSAHSSPCRSFRHSPSLHRRAKKRKSTSSLLKTASGDRPLGQLTRPAAKKLETWRQNETLGDGRLVIEKVLHRRRKILALAAARFSCSGKTAAIATRPGAARTPLRHRVQRYSSVADTAAAAAAAAAALAPLV